MQARVSGKETLPSARAEMQLICRTVSRIKLI